MLIAASIVVCIEICIDEMAEPETVESLTILNCIGKLKLTLKDRDLTVFLHQKGFILKHVYDEVVNPNSNLTEMEKADKLLQCIRDAIEMSSVKYYILVDRLRNNLDRYGDIVAFLDNEFHRLGGKTPARFQVDYHQQPPLLAASNAHQQGYLSQAALCGHQQSPQPYYHHQHPGPYPVQGATHHDHKIHGQDAFLDVSIELPFYDRISKCFKDWKTLSMHFNLDPDNFDDESKDREKKVAFLKAWKQQEAKNATYRALVMGLRAIGCMDDADKVYQLAKGDQQQAPVAAAYYPTQQGYHPCPGTYGYPPQQPNNSQQATARHYLAQPSQDTVPGQPPANYRQQPPPSQAATDADRELRSADHLMVLRAVTSISAKWQELAEELGLKSNTIRDIAVENNTNRLRLSHALTEWLQKNYKYEVHGVPSWRCLAEATRPIDRDLSIEIDRAHGIR